jgi:hypothetical protein
MQKMKQVMIICFRKVRCLCEDVGHSFRLERYLRTINRYVCRLKNIAQFLDAISTMQQSIDMCSTAHLAEHHEIQIS